MGKFQENNIKNSKLKILRKKAGLTQSELADYLVMSRLSYRNLEVSGTITGEILVKLKVLFNCEDSDILPDSELSAISAETALVTRLYEHSHAKLIKHILSDDETELLFCFEKMSENSKKECLKVAKYILDKQEEDYPSEPV